jgi:hypothetical protein
MNKQEAIDLLISCAIFDCQHCNNNYRGCEDKGKFEEVKNVIVSALSEQLTNGWIPVSERLPENDKPVLACDKYGNMHHINHIKDYRYPFNISPDNERYYEPIAWQPLPEPYKEAL